MVLPIINVVATYFSVVVFFLVLNGFTCSVKGGLVVLVVFALMMHIQQQGGHHKLVKQLIDMGSVVDASNG